MQRVLVTYQLPREGLAPLSGYTVDYPDHQVMGYDEITACLGQYDAVLAAGGKWDAPLLQAGAAGRLRMLANYGAGYDSVDTVEAARLGIIVTNIPDSVTESTAELAFGGLLALARGIARCDAGLRQGTLRWGMMNNLGYNLYGKTLGIIGMGRIGRAMARRARASGMSILYTNRSRLPAELEEGASYVPLHTLLTQSHCVSLHCPLTPETTGLLDAAAFAAMRPGALLVNTARGAVCDENALLAALRGHLGGAYLDVFAGEPAVSPAFFALDNVLLTPHIGTDAHEVRLEMTIAASQRIADFLQGKLPENIVNPDVLDVLGRR